MKELEEYNNNLFESIKHIDEEGNEYWSARELQKILQYSKWENFHKVINLAKEACNLSDCNVLEQFPEVRKLIVGGNGNKQNVLDYHLSRYACYLIAQNGDSRKKVIALAQTYFAVQTRKQELLEEEYELLSEDEKRLIVRRKVRRENYSSNQTAKKAGVKNYNRFHNAGYKGLYGGETADDIAKRKGLRYREDILDNMGSSELIVNLFRIDQTNQKLINEKITGEENANNVHYNMGKDIRKFISEQGGTMPEELPTPRKSLKEIEKSRKNIKLRKKD